MDLVFADILKLEKALGTLKNFEEWRNKNIKAYNEYCDGTDFSEISKNEPLKDLYLKFSKCMIQLTRQMCKCDQNCFNNSFKNIHFKGTVIKDKIDQVFVSNVYSNCDVYKVSVINGVMFESDSAMPFSRIELRIKESLENLCNGNQNFYNDLQCASYELKDECRDDLKCMKSYLISEIPSDCRNEEFNNKIEDIHSLIGYPIFNNTEEAKLSRGERSIVESYENLNNSFYEKSVYGNISDDTSDFPLSSVIILSGILFSTIGYLIYKVSKKLNRNKRLEEIKTEHDV